MITQTELATFGGGCFWCIDAAFRQVKGVVQVLSGYAGGEIAAPTYQQICTGQTGHAEVVQIEFDPTVVTFDTLLAMFFVLHDATQLQSSQEKIAALQPTLSAPIVTELSPAPVFYSAEQYHQDYYNANPNQGYCSIMIAPKIAKFSAMFTNYLIE